MVLALGGLLSLSSVIYYALRALVMLVAIPFHEAAHALASWLLGDDTAKRAGRLSLNPIRHFDPMGALCMIVGGVGWAKPVGLNVRRYRNPKLGMALSAAAGPLANLLLAFLALVLYKVLWYAGPGRTLDTLMLFLQLMISMNISLAVFNLIPVPPFDGSRIALLFLPEKLYFKAMRYEQYIMLAVLGLVFLGVLDAPLSAAVDFVWELLFDWTWFVERAFGLGV